ncbi:MAG: ABC-type nitrate/sulfonate/bicarbonate transport system, ATPase component [Candidatus Jettenia ecosi]|uniref:ABC-type nitrate/sulfonate/bicarbonate transport system, ATPase component n=1 Tax=Candidatus Jettenia ecosi TaxID=2494326 RepID=A0A533QCY8_9BACT|nr:MAG: ABC-type nitrate/sulfonate/bicarbonate transport system, ATPase component [Candidatus Jettenia ecosi]
MSESIGIDSLVELDYTNVKTEAQTSTKLRIQHLSKSFQSKNGKVYVLEDINLEIRQGEFVCIVGPSGCGKTTLLNIVAGLEKADSGEIWANGRRVNGAGTDRVVIFQEAALFPWMNVIKNVEFGLKLKGVNGSERRNTAIEYLKMVHLSKFQNSHVHELSGGMKQRVAIARALAMNPEMLLMDEPFSALDAQTRWILHFELQNIWLKTKKTILFITHNIREAVCLADRIIVLSTTPGKIKKEFLVDLPRPRDDNDVNVAEYSTWVMKELKAEISKVVKCEMDTDSCVECDIKCTTDEPAKMDIGGGI